VNLELQQHRARRGVRRQQGHRLDGDAQHQPRADLGAYESDRAARRQRDVPVDPAAKPVRGIGGRARDSIRRRSAVRTCCGRSRSFAGGINQDFNNIGYAKYRALEMAMNKRLSHDVLATVTYTWSQRRTANNLQNTWDEKPFEDIDSNDRPHRLTITRCGACRSVQERLSVGTRLESPRGLLEGWQYNIHRRDFIGTPLGMNSAAIPVGRPLRVGVGPAGAVEMVRHQYEDQPARGRHVRMGRHGANDFRVSQFFLPDVRQDSKPQWSMSLFKNTRAGGNKMIQFPLRGVQRVQRPPLRWPEYRSDERELRIIGNSQINFARTGQLGVRFTF